MASETSCHCPDIQDQDWHLKDLDWSGKFFYFEYVRHIFNVPLGMDKTLQQMKQDIEHKGYRLLNPDMVLYLPGTFQGKIFMEIADPEQYDANVEVFQNARILTRLYKGPRSQIKEAVTALVAFTQDRALIEPNAIYYWHVTCDKCAKLRGGEKTILFARV
jgi:hypothetical protein